ncbi:MAG: hypothetical protein KAV41_00910 [Candidatus Pacebacteria bacterium]|nr:hypothetical protein [Candidatus Paceibacterota bacterium]
MNSYEIYAFSLSAKEKEECRFKKIPNFYWYYLQKLGARSLKELIQDRIQNLPFSKGEKKNLARDILKQIRKFVLQYQANKYLKITELEEKFDFEIFSLIKRIFRRREIMKKSLANKKELRKICQIVSKIDGEILRPALNVLKGLKDCDCLYFPECRAFAKKNKMCLDCSFCEKHYYI